MSLCQDFQCQSGICVSVPKIAGTNCTHRVNESNLEEVSKKIYIYEEGDFVMFLFFISKFVFIRIAMVEECVWRTIRLCFVRRENIQRRQRSSEVREKPERSSKKAREGRGREGKGGKVRGRKGK